MAPRSRTRRNTRMDAAVCAMDRMGFQEGVVRNKVKELLKVYDGDHGWPFIEDNAYMLLIEALINPSEEEAEGSDEEIGEGSHLQNNSSQEQEAPAAVTSNAIADSVPIEHGVVQAVSESVRTGDSAENETAVAVSNIANDLPAQIPAIAPSSSSQANGVQPANSYRRPCYGWLDYDEGELDFIYLTPAASHTPIPSDGTTSKRIRRKSRWDLTPEDL